MNRLTIVGVFLFALGGCAAGNQYDYFSANIGLPIVGTDALGVAVVDRRPYVLSGNKRPEYVGTQRGGFGNPFNVTTASGKPMATDMQAALARALEDKGYEVTELFFSSPDATVVAEAIKQNGAKLNVVLLLNEWKTDAMISLGLDYDVELQIVDENSEILAQASDSANKEKIGGAAMAKQNSNTAAQVFELKVARLFNDPEIKGALDSGL